MEANRSTIEAQSNWTSLAEQFAMYVISNQPEQAWQWPMPIFRRFLSHTVGRMIDWPITADSQDGPDAHPCRCCRVVPVTSSTLRHLLCCTGTNDDG